MRLPPASALPASLLVAPGLLFAGCLIDRTSLGGAVDAHVDPTVDAYVPPGVDAYVPPGVDAWVEPPDAYVPPGVDAYVQPPDAYAPPGVDAWVEPPDAYVPPDAGCVPRCEADGVTLRTCDGMMRTCGACGTTAGDSTARCLILEPSNAPAGHAVPSGAADAVVDGANVVWDTSRCDRGNLQVGAGDRQLEASQFSTFTPPGGVSVCIVSAPRFEFTASSRVTVRGSRPLVLVASESIIVQSGAVLSVASANDEGPATCALGAAGAGALPAASPLASVGQSGMIGTGMYLPDSGGGGGGFCGRGGAGGDGDGPIAGGDGGGPQDPAGLVPLRGGSPGGNGSGRNGEGGHGGGAVQLSAPRVEVRGMILAHGSGGLGGGVEGGGRRGGAGGGGGSGGAVHLEAVRLVLGGSALIDLRGGGGGAAACYDGSSIVTGRCSLRTDAPATMTGAIDACGRASGGDGASDTAIDGFGADSSYDAPGGGGGAGCLVMRSIVGPSTAPTAPLGVTTMAMPSVR
jgi:hypothetical protein